MQNSGLWIPGTEIVWHIKDTFSNDSPYGLGIDTEVRVQAFADHTLRLKFENCRIFHKMNGTLDSPVSPIVSNYILGYLEETVLVQMKRKHVKSFFVGREEPNAVTNIKRSFLSQITFDIPESSHTALKTNHTGIIIELLRSEAITARLPLPSKIRKEGSLLPIKTDTRPSGLIFRDIYISSQL